MFSSRALAFLLPLGVMLISDACNRFSRPHACNLACFRRLIGLPCVDVPKWALLSAHRSNHRPCFLGNNLAVWYGSGLFPRLGRLDGLLLWPSIFQNTVLGDLSILARFSGPTSGLASVTRASIAGADHQYFGVVGGLCPRYPVRSVAIKTRDIVSADSRRCCSPKRCPTDFGDPQKT